MATLTPLAEALLAAVYAHPRRRLRQVELFRSCFARVPAAAKRRELERLERRGMVTLYSLPRAGTRGPLPTWVTITAKGAQEGQRMALGMRTDERGADSVGKA